MRILPSVSVEQWDRSMALNLRSVMLCYKYAAIQMIKQGTGGRIIGESLLSRVDECIDDRPHRCFFHSREERCAYLHSLVGCVHFWLSQEVLKSLHTSQQSLPSGV